MAADNAPTNAPGGTPALATRNDSSLAFGPGQGAAGSRDGSIIATNQGERTVALGGSPRATIVDSAGDTLRSSSGSVSGRIDGQMDLGARAPLGPVPTGPIAAFPPSTARIIALGWGVRPSPRRISTRRSATMVPKTSASIQRRVCGETTGQGGRSAGTKRHWSPANRAEPVEQLTRGKCALARVFAHQRRGGSQEGPFLIRKYRTGSGSGASYPYRRSRPQHAKQASGERRAPVRASHVDCRARLEIVTPRGEHDRCGEVFGCR